MLSERIGYKAEIDGETEGEREQPAASAPYCRFPFIGQHVEFVVHFKLYASMKPLTVQIIATVVLTMVPRSANPPWATALAWWQFFEICLTGTTEAMEGGEGGVGGASSE